MSRYLYATPNFRELDFATKAAIAAGFDLRPVWRNVRKTLRKAQQDHLKKQVGPGGAKWRPLSRETIKSRMRKLPANSRTKKGKLKARHRRSVSRILAPAMGKRLKAKLTRRSLSFFGRGRTRHAVQGGSKVGRFKSAILPARPYVYVDEPIARDAFRQVAAHVAEGFTKAKAKR